MEPLRPLPPDDARDSQRPFRALCYSHDSYGLGHLRRSVTLAAALTARGRNVHAICLSGSPVPDLFELPERCDLVKLPSIGKANGHYVARRLPISLGEVTALRSDLITATVRSFKPDLLLVDHTVTGPGDELLPVLRRLRHEHLQTHVVLGMRDVLDAPLRARAELQRLGAFDVMAACYDQVFVYGDREVFDPIAEYGFPEPIAAKTVFTGPVVPAAARRGRRSARPAAAPHVLVTPGGGEDGYELLRGAVAALRGPLRHTALRATVVTGPLLAQAAFEDLRRAVQDDTRITLLRSTGAMQDLMDDADLVVGMGGYNTVYESLARGLPLLALPRRAPREEQWERCRRLQARGWLQVLDERDLRDPHATAAAIRGALSTNGERRAPLACDGADAAARLCLQRKRQRSPIPHSARFGG